MTIDRARLLGLSDEELMITWELVSQAVDAEGAETIEERDANEAVVGRWHDIMHGQPAGPECAECKKAYGEGLVAITIDPDIDEGVYICQKCIAQHGFAHSQTVVFKIDPAPLCYNCHEPAWED